MSVSVLLVDDQELMRMAFRMVIESQPDLRSPARPRTASTRSPRSRPFNPTSS